MSEIAIRRAEQSDLPALLDIYNHYVLNSAATFDIEPRTLDQRQEWFAQFSPSGKYRCFSAVMDGAVVGWASSARFKERAAYDTTIETSIYLAPHAAGRGLGRALYTALFDALAREDIHRIFGGVTLPNEASVRLHEGMGFRRVGVQPEVGRKFGRFWDVGLFFKDMN
jgi:phosphinothricin acetyltransferase